MGQEVIRRSVMRLAAGDGGDCACRDALAMALITDRGAIPAATARRLGPIVGRYVEVPEGD